MVNVLMFGVSSSLVCVLALAGKVAEHPLGVGRVRHGTPPALDGSARFGQNGRDGAQRSLAAVRVALIFPNNLVSQQLKNLLSKEICK